MAQSSPGHEMGRSGRRTYFRHPLWRSSNELGAARLGGLQLGARRTSWFDHIVGDDRGR